MILVLASTLTLESCSSYLDSNNIKGYDYRFHVFNLIEYSLFATYYIISCADNRYKQWVKLSIPVFIVCALSVSFFKYKFSGVPSVNIDIECFLLLILYTHLLFNLDIKPNMFIYQHHDFWISSGILIFYGGVFCSLGLYPLLVSFEKEKARSLFDYIIDPLNLTFYTCIIIGLLCTLRKKYLIQVS